MMVLPRPPPTGYMEHPRAILTNLPDTEQVGRRRRRKDTEMTRLEFRGLLGVQFW